MKKLLGFIKNHSSEILLVSILLAISGFAHGFNMFHYPYYESDEATYLSQGWAVLEQGKLAPYTYWYDHSPVGWFLIALWIKLTGGVFTFGFSVNSGRVLMLILHMFSTLFLYLIARKVTGSKMVGTIACLFFSLSPLGLYFQRRLLLDNIMIFWTFLSLNLVLFSKQKLRWIIGSAICFGIAILSKESAIFFLPALAATVFATLHHHNRIFGIGKWIAIVLGIVSLYFLYSFLKGELFPTGTLLGGSQEHVSLLQTLSYQSHRGNISIFDPQSSFWSMVQGWKNDDPIIIYLGAISTIITLLFAIKKKAARIIGGLALSYWAFLMRGGLVLEFYIIPLIPLLSLTIAYSFYAIAESIKDKIHSSTLKFVTSLPVYIVVFFLLFMMAFFSSQRVRGHHNIYTANATDAQKKAVDWILSQHLPTQFYAIDNYAYLDLNLKNDKNFKNAEYYWKVDGDRDIKEKILHGDYNNIDYILFSPLIGGDLGTGELPLVGKALAQSNPITSFQGDGWYVQIWAVKNSRRVLLSTWESYKKRFVTKEGKTIDPQSNKTTSEGQSYTMLRSVWMNDKEQFDTTWKWTKDNLQQKNNVFAWQWEKKANGTYGIVDKGSALDADEDIALALAFAGKRWNNPSYTFEAERIIQGIWNEEVKTINKKSYLVAGNWAKNKTEAIINPSYLSPASYRIFAEIDQQHDWKSLIDTSYDVLEKCTTDKLDTKTSVGLPPDWCAVDRNGKITPSHEKGLNSTSYSYDAFRTPWRIALDAVWNNESRAKKYLQTNDFIRKEWETKSKILVGYTHDGKPWNNYESAGAYAANLANFVVTDKENAKEIYEQQILNKLYEDETQSYWEDPNSYYTQNLVWFGTALYNNDLPNLWGKVSTK